MTKPMIRIHDLSTNEVIDREMTDEEFAEHELEQAKFQELEQEKADKEAAKAALLDKLGITADEAVLLLS